jgi:hypothetical protein
MTDVARLRKALEFDHAHPEEHDQSMWAMQTDCGTTMCLAGTVLAQAGYEFIFIPDSTVGVRNEHGLIRTLKAPAALCARSPEGRHVVISTEAARLLGISSLQADDLFHESHNIRELYETAHEITNGEIEIPIELQD